MKVHSISDGRKIIIREAAVSDAGGILEFGSLLFSTTDQVLTLPSEFNYTQQQEEQMIQDHADRQDALLVVAVDGGRVVGLMNFSCNKKAKINHTGEMGISVLPAYQKMGIGRAMLKVLLEWATIIPQIEKIYLNVFHTNHNAIRLYASLGFREEGRQVKAVKQPDGNYADMITMSYFK